MAFDDKGFPIFPSRDGGSIGTALENRMLGIVGGAQGIRTRIQVLPDGSTVMLKTRNGMPEFVRTPKKTKIAEGVELVFYCRLIDQTHPLGVAYNSAVNADYTIPTYPVSKGAITSATLAAEADPTLTDSPGPMRWVDSRPTKVVSETLTWASVIGQPRSELAAAYSPAISEYCHDDNVQTRYVSNPYGVSEKFTAGTGFPGQQMVSAPPYNALNPAVPGTRWRFTGVSGFTTKLFVDGTYSGISGRLAAAAIATSPDKHIKTIEMVSYGSGSYSTVCNMKVKHYTLDGETHPTLSDVVVTIPAEYTSITGVLNGPVFNSSATKFALAAVVLKVGFSVPLTTGDTECVVFEGDAMTGVLTVVSVPYVSFATTISDPPDYKLYTENGALNETWTSTRTDVVYAPLAVGYKGDALKMLIHKWTGLNTSQKVIELNSTSIPVGQTTTVNTVVESGSHTYTNSVFLYPDDVQLYSETLSGSITITTEEVINYAYSPSWSHQYSTQTETVSSSGSSASDASAATIYAAFADFVAGVFCFATTDVETWTTKSTDPFIYTKTGSGEYLSPARPGYTNGERRSAKIIFATQTGETNTTVLTDCESFTEDNAASEGGSVMPSYASVRYLYNPASYTGPVAMFSTAIRGSFHCFDGLSFAVDQDGTTCVVSALHGDHFNTLDYDPYDEYGSIPFSQLAVTNLIGTKTNNSWTFLPLTLPAYVGNLAWMSEPTFIKVKK